MASLTLRLPDEFQRLLQQFSYETEGIAKNVLKQGAVPLKKAVEKNVSRHVYTGDLLKSVKTYSPTYSKGLWRIRVGFSGYGRTRKKEKSGKRTDTSNAQKALWLEYGTSKQPATPIIRPALADSQGEVVAAMQNAFTKHLKDKGIPYG